MATYTLNRPHPFPDSTSVGAYAALDPSNDGSPQGAAVNSQTVSSGSATFTGLTEGQSYLIAGEVAGAWRSLVIEVDEPTTTLASDEDVEITGDWEFSGEVTLSGDVLAETATALTIPDDAVDSAQIADGAIDPAHLAASAVEEAKIASNAVTNAKVADDAIDSAEIADGAIDPAHLAANAVEQAKIADDAVGAAELKITLEDVTVPLGETAGTATVVAGDVILGIYPVSNQDQLIDSVAISGTTLTVTLAAAATADNVFKVAVLNA